MPDEPTILLLLPEENGAACSLLHGLYAEVEGESLHRRLRIMEAEDGYDLHGASLEGRPVGVGGSIRLTNLIHGGYLRLHDLVIAKGHRGRGLGTRMMAYFTDLAARSGFVALAAHHLDAEALRFYEQQIDYEHRGIVFRNPTGGPR